MSGTQPNISLDVMGGGGAGAPQFQQGGGLNTGALGQLVGIQNQMNQMRLFQQEFSAKQQAGQIISAAPDIDTGIKGILSNPQTAAFAPGIVNELRTMQQTMVATQGMQATQARDAFGAVLRGAAGSLNDLSRFQPLVNSQLALLPPDIRQRVMPAVQTYTESLFSGLPSDPAAAQKEFQKRFIGTVLGSGVSADAVNASLGVPTTQNIGSSIVSGVQQPVWAGGGFVPSSALPMGSAGGYQSVGGVPVAAPAVSGAGNTLGGQAPPASPIPPVSAQPVAPAAGSGSAGGGPVYDPRRDGVSPTAAPGAGLGGLNVMSPAQKSMADTMAADFAGPEKKQFDSANTSLASLRYMDSAYDNMVRGGGFLVPGTAADFRTDLARTVNTLAQITGQSPPFDPTKIASIEDFNKETKRMGLMVTNQFLGGQREAAQIIQGITTSVPGVGNSYLGGKLVSAGIQASLQRVIDQRNFQNQWQADPRNQGNLTGSIEAFNKAYPAEGYANEVLDRFGLMESGFKTPQAVGEAVRSGYLSPAQGATLLHQQFPDQFHAPGQGQGQGQ